MRTDLARMVEAHRRTLDQLTTGVAIFGANQKLAFYNAAYRVALGSRCRLPGSGAERPRGARPAARRPQASRGAGLPAMEGGAARRLSRDRGARAHVAPAGRAHAARGHHPQCRRRRDLSVRRRHRAARSGAALRCPDPGAGRDARQSGRGGRGVRQRRPPAAVQSGVRAAVEARARDARRASAHRDRDRLVPAALRRQPAVAAAARRHHRHRRPRAGERPDRAARRQRDRLRHRAAARRRHARHLPGRHRHRQRGAGAAREERGARGGRRDQGRLRAPRLLRAALAAHQHHRLCAFPRRPGDRAA